MITLVHTEHAPGLENSTHPVERLYGGPKSLRRHNRAAWPSLGSLIVAQGMAFTKESHPLVASEIADSSTAAYDTLPADAVLGSTMKWERECDGLYLSAELMALSRLAVGIEHPDTPAVDRLRGAASVRVERLGGAQLLSAYSTYCSDGQLLVEASLRLGQVDEPGQHELLRRLWPAIGLNTIVDYPGLSVIMHDEPGSVDQLQAVASFIQADFLLNR